ncbi:MAG: ABC transporter substrate-binding protein [Bacillota bacterium]
MMRKYSAITLIVTLLLSTIVGCSKDSTTFKTFKLSGTLNILEIEQKSSEYFKLQEEVVKKLESDNPDLKVTLERVDFWEYKNEIKKRNEQGETPDVFHMFGADVKEFGQKGYIADLSLFNINWEDYFTEQLIEVSSVNGKIMAVPTGTDSLVAVYRKSWFDKANIPYPQQGWTWNEFEEAVKKLKGVAGAGQKALSFPFDFDVLEPFVISNGGTYLSADGLKAKGYMDSPQTLEVFERFLSLIKNKYANLHTPDAYTVAIDEFLYNQSGIAFMPYRFLSENKEGRVTEDIQFVSLPSFKPANQVGSAFISEIGIAENSKNKEAAWAYIQMLHMDHNEFSDKAFQWGANISNKVISTLGEEKINISQAKLNELNNLKPDKQAAFISPHWLSIYWEISYQKLNTLSLISERSSDINRLVREITDITDIELAKAASN